MGNGLSKEQEQCFKLIQQLFKAAECLPSKGSLDFFRNRLGKDSKASLLATAIKGDPRCYNCGMPGHLPRDC